MDAGTRFACASGMVLVVLLAAIGCTFDAAALRAQVDGSTATTSDAPIGGQGDASGDVGRAGDLAVPAGDLAVPAGDLAVPLADSALSDVESRPDVPAPGPDAPADAPAPSPQAYGCPADPALRACYLFDEGSGGRARDQSGNGNDGTLEGATWVPGPSGSALAFPSDHTRMVAPDSASLRLTGGDYTFEAWVRPSALQPTGAVNRIADKWDEGPVGYAFGFMDVMGTGPGLCACHAECHCSTGTTFPLLTWFHVAATYSGGVLRLYKDGVDIQSWSGMTAQLQPTTTAFAVGNNGTTFNPPSAFAGAVDVVRIYARARSPEEICGDAARSWTGSSCR